MNGNELKDIIHEFFQGKYEIEKFLGFGAFSELFIVRNVFSDRLMVIKIIKKPLNSNMDSILQGDCQFKHENIVDIYDVGIIPAKDDKNGFIYFIMEYIPGGDLNQYVTSFIESNMFMPVSWVLNLIRQISLGLKVLHLSQPPVVHGDLKPNNILLSFDSGSRVVVKLTDFDFSKKLDSMLDSSDIVGTRHFMAPECFNNEFYPATDIYALGVIFYLLLTNLFPYSIDKFNLIEIMEQKPWKSHLIPPSCYNDEVSSDIDKIVMKCLAIDYSDRFLNAEELLKEIKLCMDEYPIGDDFKLNNLSKKAFKLAKYENKFDEAKDILKDSDMLSVLETLVSLDVSDEWDIFKTIKIENTKDMIKSVDVSKNGSVK